MAKKSLEIDMIAGSQLRDTQGEMLSIEGADISELEAGKGRLNDNHGKGFFNSIGTVTGAKKIFKKEDCENDRHKYYWEKVKAPFIYVKGYLYDDEDHPNARAAAAILRNIHKNDSPLQLKASVEGGVVARGLSDSTLLARTKIHSVALTFTPANNNTLVEPVSLEKIKSNKEEDLRLIKSVMHLAQKNVPSFRHIVRDAKAQKIEENLIKISELSKKLNLHVDDITISKNEILQKAIEDKIAENVKLIHDYIVNDSLDKGIKDIGMAAALSAGLATASPTEAEAKTRYPTINKKPIKSRVLSNKKPQLGSLVLRNNDNKPHIEMWKKISQIYPELGAIGCVESSCGINHDKHRTMSDPKRQDYGHTAGGIWAMMPHDMTHMLRHSEYLRNKYPALEIERKNEGTKKFQHHMFTNLLNTNPEAAADFAIAAMNYRKERTDSPGELFASWNLGINGAKKFIKKHGQKALKKIPYVKKATVHYNKFNSDNERSIASDNMLKALMAGYGGAGAPISRVGGAVLQSESPSKSLKYIVCDKCGKEQVHAKYQVKCRHCNDNFSLKKLNDILS